MFHPTHPLSANTTSIFTIWFLINQYQMVKHSFLLYRPASCKSEIQTWFRDAWHVHVEERDILVKTTPNTFACAGGDTEKGAADMNLYSSGPTVCVYQPENENNQRWLHIVDEWLLQELLFCKKIHTLSHPALISDLCADRNSWAERSETMRALRETLIRVSGKEQLNIKYQL